MMQSCPWRVLMTLGLAVTAGAAAVVAPQQEVLSHEEAVSVAIDLYNQEPEVAFAFRLLEAKPQPEWDRLSKGVHQLAFTVKETTCRASEQLNLGECPFKDDGLVKECSGTLSAEEQGNRLIQLNCETVAQARIRVRRRGLRKVFRKIKKKIKKGIKKGVQGVKKGVQRIKKGRVFFHLQMGGIPVGPAAGMKRWRP